jgi:hypothetical protein
MMSTMDQLGSQLDVSVPHPVEPGIVPAGEWRPDPGADIPDRGAVGLYPGVGRKS